MPMYQMANPVTDSGKEGKAASARDHVGKNIPTRCDIKVPRTREVTETQNKTWNLPLRPFDMKGRKVDSIQSDKLPRATNLYQGDL